MDIAVPDHHTRLPVLKRLKSKLLGPVALGSGARLIALGAQFGVVLVLARVLEKGDFGNAMLAFGLYRFVSMGMGAGLGNLILYRVSRAGGDTGLDVSLTRTVTLIAIALSIICTIIAVFGSSAISFLFSKTGLEFWLVHLSPMLLFSTLNVVAAGSLDGRSQVTKAIVLYELTPNLLRVLCISAASLLSVYSGPATALALWVPMAIPWLIENKRLLNRGDPNFFKLTKWDAKYAGYLSVNSWAGQQLQGADIIIVGYLFDPYIVADYAMASRFASLFPFFQFLLVRNFTPRLGLLISRGEFSTVDRALSELRLRTIFSVCLLTACIILGLPIALAVAGSFPLTPYIVMALAVPAVLRSAFSGTDIVMRMTGKAGIAASASVLGLLSLILIPLATSRALGIASVPASMLAYAIYINAILYFAMLHTKIRVVTSVDLLAISPAITSICFSIYFTDGLISALICFSGLLTTCIICSAVITNRKNTERREQSI